MHRVNYWNARVYGLPRPVFTATLTRMKDSQKLQIRASEIRTRLAEIAVMPDDALTAEIRTESDALGGEYGNVETRMRAALIAEDDETKAAETRLDPDAPDAETRAVRELQGRASLSRYLRSFGYGEQLAGAERELAEHRNLPTAGNWLPWDALLIPRPPGAELRDDAATTAPASGNPTNQADIIQRVFARGAVQRLGVAMPAVAVGVASYPVLAAGQSAAFVAKGAEKDAAAGDITPNNLEPKRLQARMQFRIEDSMTTTGLESGLQEDLSRAMTDQLDATVVGPGTAQVRGFLATAAHGGLTDYADPDAVVTFATAAEQAARGVDGKYAGSESECAWVIGTETYAKLAALIQANDSTSATERLRRILQDFMASANIPAAASMIQSGILAKLGTTEAINAVCPVWEGMRLIRDEITDADKGLVAVTAVALHNFKVLRPAGFIRTKVKLA